MSSNLAIATFSDLGLSATGSFESYQNFAAQQPVLSQAEEYELFEKVPTERRLASRRNNGLIKPALWGVCR